MAVQRKGVFREREQADYLNALWPKMLLGRYILEKLEGKRITDVSFTDPEETQGTNQMDVFLFLDDGTVFRVNANNFQVFGPGDYQGT